MASKKLINRSVIWYGTFGDFKMEFSVEDGCNCQPNVDDDEERDDDDGNDEDDDDNDDDGEEREVTSLSLSAQRRPWTTPWRVSSASTPASGFSRDTGSCSGSR